ncbi:MAG: zinc ribbon domain-containing protein [Clostridiales bacterium]|nr:zinc ribbon domain-containing protein [Clostridiales bacterium]
MYCPNCGAFVPEDARFCKTCGKELRRPAPAGEAGADRGPVGFSAKINDPAFARYIRNNNRWSAVFAVILAAAAVVGFYIAGEVSSEMENPGSLCIGLGIGGMFLTIALFQILGRKRSTTWDGVVEDKTVKKKTERHTYGDGDVSDQNYLEYTVVIRSDRGKRYSIRVKNDDTMYRYYRIGDRVRHHAGLNSYEKYDKTGDRFIPCAACGTICDIKDEVCRRCKCPLLK